MPLQFDAILDDVATTLRDLGRLKWTDLASNLQDYTAMSELFKVHKVGFQDGYGIQFNAMVSQPNSAKMTGLYAVDVVNVVDVMKTGNLPWRHAVTDYAIDLHEITMNGGASRIVELLKTRRSGAMISLAELLETQVWSLPTGTSDTGSLFGIPYWIVPNVTQGFNGLNPFGYSGGAASIDSTVYANWANYTDSYVDVTKTDLIRKWRRAARFTNFKSPVGADVPSYNTGDRYGYYTTYFVLGRLEEALEAQNDNLGVDVASKDGQTVFRRVPVMWVQKFESLMASSAFANATYTSSGGQPCNGVYGINWGVLRPVFMKGWYMKETGPKIAANQHNVAQTFIDLTVNIECRDRRRQFVLTQ